MRLAEERDVAEAAKRLANAATASTNQTNVPAYTLYRNLSDEGHMSRTTA